MKSFTRTRCKKLYCSATEVIPTKLPRAYSRNNCNNSSVFLRVFSKNVKIFEWLEGIGHILIFFVLAFLCLIEN